jgi:hypothetical protein
MVCLNIGNLLFSKLVRPPTLAATNLRLSFSLYKLGVPVSTRNPPFGPPLVIFEIGSHLA